MTTTTTYYYSYLLLSTTHLSPKVASSLSTFLPLLTGITFSLEVSQEVVPPLPLGATMIDHNAETAPTGGNVVVKVRQGIEAWKVKSKIMIVMRRRRIRDDEGSDTTTSSKFTAPYFTQPPDYYHHVKSSSNAIKDVNLWNG